MLEFKKGNQENLEGKAIVYSRFKSKDGNGIRPNCKSCDKECPVTIKDGVILALYFATNITDYMEKIGVPQEVIEAGEDIEKKVREITDKLGEKSKTPMYAVPITITSETDLLLGSEDILFVGEYSDTRRCVKAVLSGLELYFLMFCEQLERKHDLDPCQDQKTKLTYKDFEGESIRKQIIDNYLVPMLDAQRYGDSKKFREAKKRFIRFSAKAPFFTDTLDLCKAILNTEKTPNTNLTDAFLAKIIAVHTEDYSAAAELRDRIRELTG